MSPPSPRRSSHSRPSTDRGASIVEYAALIVLAALILAALTAAVSTTTITDNVRQALCTILRIENCPALKPPRAQAPPEPTTEQARCVRDQRISYVEAQGYARPRIVGVRGGMRWTTTTRVISHGPGTPDTYEVTLQSWKEGAVEAGIKGGGKLPADAMAYLGLNATEGKTWTFGSKQQADDFQKEIPRYFIGGTAYDAAKTATGPVGTVLGWLDSATGGHVKKWAQGDPPKPQQEYDELGPTAGVDLRADIPLGGDNQVSLGAKGRFWRLYGRSKNNETGESTYYLRQNNEIQPTVSINLSGYASTFKGLTGKDLEAAVSKAVFQQTGRAVGVPASVLRTITKYGAVGLSLKWKPNTQYQVTTDKDGNLTRVTKVDDTILTWYAQGSSKGTTIGGDDGSPDKNGRGRHRKPTDPKIKNPRVQGLNSIASSRTTETDTLDLNTPEERDDAAKAMSRILLGNYVNPVTPPSDDALEQAFRDRGTKTRLTYDNDVKGGKAEGQSYGAKGLLGLEISGEDEQDHLSGAEYWDPTSASWKTWANCR